MIVDIITAYGGTAKWSDLKSESGLDDAALKAQLDQLIADGVVYQAPGGFALV